MEYNVPKYTPSLIRVPSWLTSTLINDLFIWNIISGFGRARGNFQDFIMGAVGKKWIVTLFTYEKSKHRICLRSCPNQGKSAGEATHLRWRVQIYWTGALGESYHAFVILHISADNRQPFLETDWMSDRPFQRADVQMLPTADDGYRVGFSSGFPDLITSRPQLPCVMCPHFTQFDTSRKLLASVCSSIVFFVGPFLQHSPPPAGFPAARNLSHGGEK